MIRPALLGLTATLLVACGVDKPVSPMASGGASGSGGVANVGGSAGAAGMVEDPDPEPELSAEAWSALRELSPEALPPVPADASNAFSDDPDAALLGQALFFEPIFSGPLLDGDNDGSPASLGVKGDVGKVSCASCHVADDGFSDTRSIRQQISLGSGWGLRRAPSLLDVAQSALLMWDGRRDSLFSQVFGPLESEVEMNSSRLFAAQQMFASYREPYEAVFGALPALDDPERFPPLTAVASGCLQLDKDSRCVGVMRGAPGDGAEFDGLSVEDQDEVTRVWVNVGKAIAAYERRLSCGQGRFDTWLAGDDGALTRAEQRGAALFVGKAGCVGCHSGPFLSDERFHNIGLQPQLVATVFLDANDPGAETGLKQAKDDPLNVTGVFSDGDDGRLPSQVGAEYLGAFRTPRLRCVAERPSFMHTGHMLSLEQVVEFKSRGGDQFGYPGQSEISPLDLSAREQADLVAFLATLSGPGPDASLLSPP